MFEAVQKGPDSPGQRAPEGNRSEAYTPLTREIAQPIGAESRSYPSLPLVTWRRGQAFGGLSCRQ